MKNNLSSGNEKRIKRLGQFFTTRPEYILQGLSIPNNANIIEPFAGNGDLVVWLSKFKFQRIECFDLISKHSWITCRDTLLNAPCYSNKYIVTNPPFVSKSNSFDKMIFNKYKANNLYKCFILSFLNSNCLGGILILPANFWFSHSDLKLRQLFLKKYKIMRINFFEEQIFDNVRVVICSFDFRLKKSENNVTNIFFFPSNKFFSVDINSGMLVDIAPSFIPCKSIKLANASTNTAKILNSTSIVLQTIDSSPSNQIRLSLVNDLPTTSKACVRISTNIFLSLDQQHKVVDNFNVLLKDLRNKHSSVLFPYFLGCKYMGFNRKRIPISAAFRIINSMLRDLNFV